MEGANGRLPTQVGRTSIITCKGCGKKHKVTYHNKALENDTYVHRCSCGHELFAETGGHGYGVVEM